MTIEEFGQVFFQAGLYEMCTGKPYHVYIFDSSQPEGYRHARQTDIGKLPQEQTKAGCYDPVLSFKTREAAEKALQKCFRFAQRTKLRTKK